jgi:hypothetical protein
MSCVFVLRHFPMECGQGLALEETRRTWSTGREKTDSEA